jgi:hypothetical protein
MSVILNGEEQWINRDSDRYVTVTRDGPQTESPTQDLLSVILVHRRERTTEETAYRLTVETYTDLWFADTPAGRENRPRLAQMLKRISSHPQLAEIDAWADGDARLSRQRLLAFIEEEFPEREFDR